MGGKKVIDNDYLEVDQDNPIAALQRTSAIHPVKIPETSALSAVDQGEIDQYTEIPPWFFPEWDEVQRRKAWEHVMNIGYGIAKAVADGLATNEQKQRQEICMAVLEEALVRGELNLMGDRELDPIKIFCDNHRVFTGQLVRGDHAKGAYSIEMQSERSMMNYTSTISIKSMLCVALYITPSAAQDVWRDLVQKFDSKWRILAQDATIHDRHLTLKALLEADVRHGKKTYITLYMRGGLELEGELVAVDRCGCLVKEAQDNESLSMKETIKEMLKGQQSDSKPPEPQETYYFVPFDAIGIHGISSDRFDEIEEELARNKKKPIPKRIELKRKREAQRLDDFGMGEFKTKK